MESDSKKVDKVEQKWKLVFEYLQLKDLKGIIIKNGILDQAIKKNKTKAFQNWLFGNEFINSIFIMSDKAIIFYGNSDQINYLKMIKSLKGKLILIEKKNDVEQNLEIIFELLQATKILKFGTFTKEKQRGKMIDLFDQKFKEKGFNEVQLQNDIKILWNSKNQQEIEYMKISAQNTNLFLENLIQKIENIIEDDLKLNHIQISQSIENQLSQYKSQKKIQDNIDFFYPPLIQSGGEQKFNIYQENTEEVLQNDIIVLSIGVKYNKLKTNCIRTLMINPSELFQKNYEALNYLHKITIENIQVNIKLNELYLKIQTQFLEKFPDFKNQFPKCLGSGIGYQFKENVNKITNKNKNFIQKNVFINVVTQFDNIKELGKNYTIVIGNVVFVQQDNQVVLLTNKVEYEYKIVAYDFKEQNDIVQPKQYTKKEKQEINQHTNQRKRQFFLETKKAQQIKDRQIFLMDQKMLELKEKVKRGEFGLQYFKDTRLHLQSIELYKDGSIPYSNTKKYIQLDHGKQALLFPINGSMIPLHIACLKNVTKHQSKNILQVRFNFQTPSISQGNLIFPTLESFGNYPIYIEELTYKTSNVEGIYNLISKIKDMQKQFKLNQKIQNQETQEPTKKNDIGKKLNSIKELKMRPTLQGRKTQGILAAHKKGLRFKSKRNEIFDLPLSNIKEAIFQPCNQNSIIILHFFLKKSVVINKKLTRHIQFYTDVGYTSEDLSDPKKKNLQDDDNYDEEKYEEEAKKNYNKLFQNFVDFLQKQWKHKIIFDYPDQNLKFIGSPFHNNVYIIPCLRNLVSIEETPFLVVPYDDIELFSIERVDNKIKNFDLIIIFKDYSRQVQTINNIPKESLDLIKQWITTKNLVFIEGGTVNVKWEKFLKKIIDDPQKFIIEEGGWYGFVDDSDDDSEDDPDYQEEVQNLDSQADQEEQEDLEDDGIFQENEDQDINEGYYSEHNFDEDQFSDDINFFDKKKKVKHEITLQIIQERYIIFQQLYI